MNRDIVYCDNCAIPLKSENEQYPWSESPIDFDSGNKGESAIFCNSCNNFHQIIIPAEKWVELYAELSEYILEYASLDPIYDDEGNRTEEKQNEFIDIVNSVESIMEGVLTKGGV